MLLELSRRELMRMVVTSAPAMKLREALNTVDWAGPELRRVNVVIPGLDRRLDGLRIGQVSDVHVGATLGIDHLKKAMATFGRRGPDIMVCTGDLLDDPRAITACCDALASVRAPYGTFYAMGNHENYGDRPHVEGEVRRHGVVKLLLNEETFVRVGDATMHISGVEFPIGQSANARREPINALNVHTATVHAEDADFRLMLAHHPDDFDEVARRGVELTLSGHTHGGQVAPLGPVLTGLTTKYVLGHYKQGRSHLYVNGGTGHSMPVRLGIPAEVTEVTLRRA